MCAMRQDHSRSGDSDPHDRPESPRRAQAALDVQPHRFREEHPRFFFRFAFRVATLQRGADREIVSVLIALDDDRQLVGFAGEADRSR